MRLLSEVEKESGGANLRVINEDNNQISCQVLKTIEPGDEILLLRQNKVEFDAEEGKNFVAKN